MHKKISDQILLILTAIGLLLGSVGLTFFPAARFSATENRTLAPFPTLTAEGLRNGTLMQQLESYATERVPFRGICRKVYGACELALLRREAHGVILCRDGSLLRRLPVNERAFSQNLTALSRLCSLAGETPCTVAIAPRRIDARTSLLPHLYDATRDAAVWERLPSNYVTFPEITDDSCWFRTDHHWTAQGAYLAYCHLGEALGYIPYPRAHFESLCVCQNFYGTSHAAAGLPFIPPDTVCVFRFPEEQHLRVLRDGEPAAFAGAYDLEKGNTATAYEVFLGGNCGVLCLEMGEQDTRPTLLVVKDSFANALLPLLSLHYRIVALDPRYPTPSPTVLLQEADHVLFLCGMQSISESSFFPPAWRR